MIGYQAGKSAIKTRLVSTLHQVALFGVISASLTASFFAVVFCSCVTTLVLSFEERLQNSDDGLFNYLERADISAAMLVLIMLGLMIGTILLYAAFGAVGGFAAAIRTPTVEEEDIQFRSGKLW